MYQRMFEGLTFHDKISKTNTIFKCQYMSERSKCENKWCCLSPTFNLLSSEYLLAAVVFYDWDVLEEERHDSALKRNKEALVTELKLWEGYLGKVAHAYQGYREPYRIWMCFNLSGLIFQAGPESSSCRTILHAGWCDRVSNHRNTFPIWVSCRNKMRCRCNVLFGIACRMSLLAL